MGIVIVVLSFSIEQLIILYY